VHIGARAPLLCMNSGVRTESDCRRPRRCGDRHRNGPRAGDGLATDDSCI
jgi:hypothetical protein